ncbi:MAG: Rrf2 family transcriptional regulator [Candidatus Rokubacteria bacterium]|nr:Rrf2 family transcriptional regulator [Candidatus Rokubacteria bacterium]
MRLTRECDYAFVVLVFLSGQERGRVISCDDLATLLSMPYDFLAKILQKLSRAGLVESKQGPYGGYCLTRKPAEITFTDVFRAMDDPVRLVECVEPEIGHCPRLSVCAIIEAMRAVHRKVIASLDTVTLADLIRASQEAPAPVHPAGLGLPADRYPGTPR